MRINSLIFIGIVLIVLGIVAFAYHGIPLYKPRERYRSRLRRQYPKDHSDVAAVDRVSTCEWRRAGRGWIEKVILAAPRGRIQPRFSMRSACADLPNR